MSLACVFPGQGSQAVGMLAGLAGEPVVRAVFDEAGAALGYDLLSLCLNGPEAELNQTARTQPAMLAAGVAVWRLWQARGGSQPVVMAGHSLGEYTALVCAGALEFAEAVRLVEARGQLMQEAVPAGQGAMAAILGLDDAAVRAACVAAAQGEVVEAVNLNAPGQVVIAGTAGAVARAIEALKAAGAKRALPLPVSAPSHCALMRPAAEKLAQRLAATAVQPPRIPVLHNADVLPHSEPDAIRAALATQLHSPVRWVETVQALRARGVSRVLELGPGKVLSGLIKRIDKDLPAACIHDIASLEEALGSST